MWWNELALPKFIYWSLSQYLRTCFCLEIGLLQMQLIKMRSLEWALIQDE
jgi:hypothetical protein